MRDRLIDVYEVANWLGYRVPRKPLPKDAPAEERNDVKRQLNAFCQNLARGIEPPPDRRRGNRKLWLESTIESHINKYEVPQERRYRQREKVVSDE